MRHRLFRLARQSLPLTDRLLTGQSLIGDMPVLDRRHFGRHFPWTALLEENWETVAAEADALLQSEAGDDAGWEPRAAHALFLWGYGYRVAENCRPCPRTARLLEQIPGLHSAFFSVLEPDGYATGPRAATKGLITCHLALSVPSDWKSCRLCFAARTAYWIEGTCLIFDESYRPAARNDSDERRVVLALQIKRPLRRPGRLLGALVLRLLRWCPTIQIARHQSRVWEKALQDVESD